MRICVAFDCLYPCTIGGAERWYRNLVERLAQDGHEVTYLTLRQWERGEKPELGPRIRLVAAGPRMALYANGRRRILPALVFGIGVLLHLLRHRREYDAVHMCATPMFSLLAAALVRPVARYRLVVDWHEVWSERYWRTYLGGVAGRIGAFVQRLCARVPQQAFCLSELHARRLRAEGCRGPITVLRGLYAGARVPRDAAEADRLVLFAGRLIPEKRAPLAVAAFAIAAQSIEGLRGEFYGDGPERDALLRAIREHDVSGIVHAPGFVEQERIEESMGRAMCMLSTSQREGYGLVVVEAAARGAPSVVVSGEDNAATELIEDGVNGFVAEREDPETIAAAIVRVHEAGASLRSSTSSWFAQNAETLSLERSLQAVLKSYGLPAAAIAATAVSHLPSEP